MAGTGPAMTNERYAAFLRATGSSSTPMMSDSFMMRSSSPLILTSVPDHLPNSTRSPALRSIAISLPLSSRPPGPTAMTSPREGFSLAVSGMMMPPADLSSASMRLTTTRSWSGRNFMVSPTLLRFHGFLTDCLRSESLALQMWAFSTALHRVLVGTFKILEGYGYQQLVLVEKDLKGRITTKEIMPVLFSVLEGSDQPTFRASRSRRRRRSEVLPALRSRLPADCRNEL